MAIHQMLLDYSMTPGCQFAVNEGAERVRSEMFGGMNCLSHSCFLTSGWMS
jgi:hypothetical protein